MSFDSCIEKMKQDPLEYKRQTGRTTRLVEAAITAAKGGKQSIIIFKDKHMADLWRDKIGPMKNLSIEAMAHDPKKMDIDWERLVFTGERNKFQLFIDHDVFESTFRYMLKAWTEHDLPIDGSPYLIRVR